MCRSNMVAEIRLLLARETISRAVDANCFISRFPRSFANEIFFREFRIYRALVINIPVFFSLSLSLSVDGQCPIAFLTTWLSFSIVSEKLRRAKCFGQFLIFHCFSFFVDFKAYVLNYTQLAISVEMLCCLRDDVWPSCE